MSAFTRRDFVRTAGAAIPAAAIGPQLLAKTEGGRQPNILFIMTDQQHNQMMSCADNPWLSTPHLDGLAAEGNRFELAYATNPVCVPSRISMATGMMPGRVGAGDNGSGTKAQLSQVIDENSMGNLMKRAGYDTFYGGKVHMCKQLTPISAGYDAFCKDQRDELPGECLEFIKQKRDKPFFAVASFINPHDICFAHRAHMGQKSNVKDLYDEGMALPLEELPPLPDNHGIQEGEPSAIQAGINKTAVTPVETMRADYDERAWRVNRYIYHRLTERVDAKIGEILDGLKEAGLEKNTLIIFTSDHGDMNASHQLASKGKPYEESVRIPFIMKYKGVIPTGLTDSEHLVSSGIDILPTLCDYAGVEIPDHLIGQSLRPIAEGNPSKDWRSYLVSESHSWRMLRTERFKYTTFSDPESQESLVDLEKDPGEMQNIVNHPEYKTILREHRQILAEWSKLSGDEEAHKYARNDDGSSSYTPSQEPPVQQKPKRKRKQAGN